MKRLLILALVLLLAVGQVGAVRETLQDWSTTGISAVEYTRVSSGGLGGSTINPTIYVSSTTGVVNFVTCPGGRLGYWDRWWYIKNTDPTTFTYMAVDYYTESSGTLVIALLDSSGSTLWSTGQGYYGGTITAPTSLTRYEVKIVGGSPTLYTNGVAGTPGAPLSVNPSYVQIWSEYQDVGSGHVSHHIDNLVVGESDHHVVGSIPSNWTIIRDLTNPSATGVYAWNPSTSAWVLKNSNNFYIDADTDSTDSTYTENVIITNVQYGTIVNTTVIDSTVPRHQLTYNVNAFLNTPTALGTAIPDGEYSVCFQGSTVCENLWVISNGASISLDKTSYIIGDSAIVSYTMLPAYFDTATYTYTLKLLNVYGEEIESKPINSATGVDAFTFDTAGVQFIEVIATKKSDASTYILGYASTTVYEYLAFSGHVYDGNTTAALSGVAFNFTQGSTKVVGTSGYDGNFSASGFGSGSVLTYNFTKMGYYARNYSFTPLTTGTKALNVTLAPKPPIYTGIGLGGVLTDSVYGSTIPDVTVTATNGTILTVTANSRGYYIFDNTRGGPLTSGRCYQMNAVKTGYTFALPTACVGV